MKKKLKNQSNKLKAAIYIRVSSEEQAMHGLSLQAQRETLLNYAKDNHLEIVDIYADEGVTARKKYKNRSEFMRMLNDVEEGKIDLILFIKLDRWFRNVSDYYEVQRILDDHNVQWVATEERYDTTTANGRLNLNIRLSIAQDESDRTSERIKFVFKDKLRRGEVISGKIPLGYKISDKKLVIDEDNAGIVRDIFQYYIDVRSIRESRKYVFDKYKLYYTQTGLRTLLQNKRYIGKAHGSDHFCKAIIPEDIFYITQEIMDSRAQRCSSKYPDRVYLFSGLIYCAECGNRLSGHVVKGKYIYYRCTKYEKMHICYHKKMTNELVLEDWLLENIESQFALYNIIIESKNRCNQQTVDIKNIKLKMQKLKDLYLNDLIDKEDYKCDYLKLKNKLNQPTPVEQHPVDFSWIHNINSTYSALDRPKKKAFWSNLIEKIIIDNQDNFTAYPISCIPLEN